MHPTLHDERWVWKSIPFEITDQLYEQALIDETQYDSGGRRAFAVVAC
jgi:hypothetical protein